LNQVLKVVALERVLILGIALASPDVDVLDGVEEKAGAGDARELGAKAGDDLIDRHLALPIGRKNDEHIGLVDGPPPPPLNATVPVTSWSWLTVWT